jgi:hypothetical protein
MPGETGNRFLPGRQILSECGLQAVYEGSQEYQCLSFVANEKRGLKRG